MTKDIKRCRKAYRHIVADSTGIVRRRVSMRKRMAYFESFPVQVRRMVIG